MNFVLKLLLALVINNYESDGYRILAIFPHNSRSQNNVFEGITRGLAKSGHQVDVISHFKMMNSPKNYRTIISLSGTRNDIVNNITAKFISEIGIDIIPTISKMFGNELCELLGLKEIQELIKNPPQNPPYNVLITQSFAANCFLGIGYILKIPIITASASLEFSWTSDAIGNPDSIAFAPNVLMRSTEVSTFWERIENAIINYWSLYQFQKYTDDIQTKLMRRYLSPDIPNIRDVEKSTALTFVNSFHSLSGIRIRSPALVDIAGIHIEDVPMAMSKEIEDWLDDSKNGVVYFSLGSLVLIESIPQEKLLSIFSSFDKIAPVRVVMKIVNKKNLPFDIPRNVFASKWIPQLQVLKHNNTRLFITHGGLMSTLEALYFRVPIIGIPLFYDQFFNVRTLVKKNMAIELDYKKITETSLDKAMSEILHNSKYRESVKHEFRLFHDRPMNATEVVNFWVEYVVRNGPNSLKSPAVNLYWWQLSLFDVYGFLLLCSSIIICFLYFSVKYLIYVLSKIKLNN